MSQTITLQLPDEVMEQVTKAAAASGRAVEDMLQTWITSTAKTVNTLGLLEHPNELHTPVGSEQTAQELLAYNGSILLRLAAVQDQSDKADAP